MFRVVIDTNLLIDAKDDFYNYANRIIDEVLVGQLEAYANKSTLNENKLIVRQKISDPGFARKLDYYFNSVKLVNGAARIYLSEDPEDNKLLESAVAANADYLITQDRHLLTLEQHKGTKIVTPTEFWNQYQDKTANGWMDWLRKFVK